MRSEQLCDVKVIDFCLSKASKSNYEGRTGCVLWTSVFYFTIFHTLRMTLAITSKWTREDWVVFLALLSCTISSFIFLYHRRQRGAIKPCCRASEFPKVKSQAISKKKSVIFYIWTFDLCLSKTTLLLDSGTCYHTFKITHIWFRKKTKELTVELVICFIF